eukprot:1127982-Rhodomonas_salina.2
MTSHVREQLPVLVRARKGCVVDRREPSEKEREPPSQKASKPETRAVTRARLSQCATRSLRERACNYVSCTSNHVAALYYMCRPHPAARPSTLTRAFRRA